MMENVVLVVHVLVALAIIGLILLQQGKGAEMGASFGSGASQTVFGSQGSGNFFSRATAVLATVFFVTSFALAVLAKDNAQGGLDLGLPELLEQQESIPALDQGDIPAGDMPAVIPQSDLPATE